MVKTIYPGSYKQLQHNSAVFIRANGKGSYIGKKQDNSIININKFNGCPFLMFFFPDLFKTYEFSPYKLSVKVNGKLIKLDKKQARCCFGFYEVDCG